MILKFINQDEIQKKMTNRKRILFSCFLFLFVLISTSCERFSWATIINNSSNVVTVKIKYDLEYLKNAQEDRKHYTNDSIEIVDLKPGDEYTLKGNIRVKPNFKAIKEIEIYSSDTVLLKAKRAFLDELFSTNEEKGIYELNIN